MRARSNSEKVERFQNPTIIFKEAKENIDSIERKRISFSEKDLIAKFYQELSENSVG